MENRGRIWRNSKKEKKTERNKTKIESILNEYELNVVRMFTFFLPSFIRYRLVDLVLIFSVFSVYFLFQSDLHLWMSDSSCKFFHTHSIFVRKQENLHVRVERGVRTVSKDKLIINKVPYSEFRPTMLSFNQKLNTFLMAPSLVTKTSSAPKLFA